MAHDGLLSLQVLAWSRAQFKVSLERMADAQNPPDPERIERTQRQRLRHPPESLLSALGQTLQR